MQPTIAPILPQPVDTLPRVTPGENFSNMISDAFKLANAGGKIAGDARKQLEIKSGKKVISTENYLTEIKPKTISRNKKK